MEVLRPGQSAVPPPPVKKITRPVTRPTSRPVHKKVKKKKKDLDEADYVASDDEDISDGHGEINDDDHQVRRKRPRTASTGGVHSLSEILNAS